MEHAQLAAVDVQFLDTCGASHEWAFGALAELLDNSRDARATLIKIDALLQNGLRVLRVEDNGCGMRGVALKGMLDFGKTEFSAERIGCYGMGSKSGMMRLASDALILSAREGTLAVGMLSRSFHRSHELNKVTLYLPSS